MKEIPVPVYFGPALDTAGNPLPVDSTNHRELQVTDEFNAVLVRNYESREQSSRVAMAIGSHTAEGKAIIKIKSVHVKSFLGIALPWFLGNAENKFKVEKDETLQ